MFFVDTHCHITDESFRGKDSACSDGALGYIQRAVAAGVWIMLQADVDSTERCAMLDLVRRFPKELRAMIGLYPGSVKENWRDEIEAMVKAAQACEAD